MKLQTVLTGGFVAALAGLAAAAQPKAPAMPPPQKAIGLMSATFAASDLDRSIAFYTKGLGLTAPARIENERNTEAPLLFPAGGPSLLLIRSKGPSANPERPPRIGRVIVDVPDLRALEARLNGAGYRLASPIAENPRHHVLVAVVQDPDGNELELVQRPR
jgi:catechol 2,3-dioxygenase-like lactoylglutathione lyase family enzyme